MERRTDEISKGREESLEGLSTQFVLVLRSSIMKEIGRPVYRWSWGLGKRRTGSFEPVPRFRGGSTVSL